MYTITFFLKKLSSVANVGLEFMTQDQELHALPAEPARCPTVLFAMVFGHEGFRKVDSSYVLLNKPPQNLVA